MSFLQSYNKYKRIDKFYESLNATVVSQVEDFTLMSKNHELLYDFIADAPKHKGYRFAHFYGCKGSGKTTSVYHALDYLFKSFAGLKAIYFKNAIKELKDIQRDLVALGNKQEKESILINKGYIDFGYFSTHGLNKKHGGSYDIVVIEEAQICNDLDELDRIAKMLLRGGKAPFKLLIYIYNPDVSGRNNYDLIRLQQQAGLVVKFIPTDNPILYNQQPHNYWDILGEGLSEDAYKGWILGDLNISSRDNIFNRGDMHYGDYKFLSPIMYIDPAVAEEYVKGSMSACTILEKDNMGIYHVLSIALEKHIVGASVDFVALAEKHNVKEITIETNQGGISVKTDIKREVARLELDIKVKGKHNHIDKEERIRVLNIYDKNNIVFHNSTNNFARQQILKYNFKTPALHSDTLDSMAGVFKVLNKPKIKLYSV